MRNEIEVLEVGKLYMIYWIQFSQLISGCSFQHVCFVSITSGFICKCVLKANYFMHLVPSFTPSHSNVEPFARAQFSNRRDCRLLVWFLYSHDHVSLLRATFHHELAWGIFTLPFLCFYWWLRVKFLTMNRKKIFCLVWNIRTAIVERNLRFLPLPH